LLSSFLQPIDTKERNRRIAAIERTLLDMM
jgi:hypothetical protein